MQVGVFSLNKAKRQDLHAHFYRENDGLYKQTEACTVNGMQKCAAKDAGNLRTPFPLQQRAALALS